MTITVTRSIRLIGYRKVYFSSACGDAAGAWQGDTPKVQNEYSVETSISKPVRWGAELQPSAATTPSLKIQEDTVVLVGDLIHYPQYHEDHYMLRINEGFVDVFIEEEKPDMSGDVSPSELFHVSLSHVSLSIPFHRVELFPYFT